MGIYRVHLGEAYAHAPAAVRRFHDLSGEHRLEGRVDVQGPQGAAGRILAWLFRLPHTGKDLPLTFELQADADREIWTRLFPDKRMRSRLSLNGAYLVEDFGPVRLWFQLGVEADAIAMNVHGLTVFGLPVPRALHPAVRAIETGGEDRIHFDVEAYFPRNRRMVAYKGYLILPTEAD